MQLQSGSSQERDAGCITAGDGVCLHVAAVRGLCMAQHAWGQECVLTTPPLLPKAMLPYWMTPPSAMSQDCVRGPVPPLLLLLCQVYSLLPVYEIDLGWYEQKTALER